MAHTATRYAAKRTSEDTSVAVSRPDPFPLRSRYTPIPPTMRETRRMSPPMSPMSAPMASQSGSSTPSGRSSQPSLE